MLRTRSILHAPFWRSLTGLAALLVLLGQAAAFVHVAGSRHEICASHGDVVEGGTDCDTAPSAGSERQDGSTDHDRHHECAVLHLWGQTAPIGDARVSLAATDEPCRLESTPALETRAAAVPTWRLAPKNSPPTA